MGFWYPGSHSGEARQHQSVGTKPRKENLYDPFDTVVVFTHFDFGM